MDQTQFVPSVVQFSPTLSDSNVPPRPDIWVRFSTEIDPTTINTDVLLNQVTLLIEEASATSISVTFVSYEDRVLTFRPVRDLSPGKVYQMTVLGKIPTPVGRTLQLDRTWTFQIAPSVVGTASLLTPADSTAVAVNPLFTWTSVTVSSTGLLQYLIEVDQTLEFSSISSRGWSTLTTATSALPGPALTPGNTYFWRVTAVLTNLAGSVWGASTDPWAFYIGTFLQPSKSTEVLYPDANGFLIKFTSFLNGLSNQSNWPSLQFDFSTVPDSGTINTDTVSFIKRAVDGDPTRIGGTVLYTWTLSGTLLTIFPQEPIFQNTRYTITFRSIFSTGGVEISTTQYYFTSRYSPLYLGLEVLRANYPQFLMGYSDDFLNFHIYRSSLDVNRHYIRVFNPGWINAPSETTVRNQNVPTIAWGMERWVELDAGRRVLTEVLHDFLATSGRMRRLGNYEEENRAEVIRYLQAEIRRITQESTYWIAEFSKKRARPRTVRKDEYYPRWREGFDMSRWNRGRKEI